MMATPHHTTPHPLALTELSTSLLVMKALRRPLPTLRRRGVSHLTPPTLSRCFCSSGDASGGVLEGFNQVLRISFQISPAASSMFETVVSKFAINCLYNESPHLKQLDVLKQQNSSGAFTLFQTYNNREGFMNHRMSNHFMEFMQTSGPFMTGDVDLLEYRSLYPSPDQWGVEAGKGLSTIQVSLTAQEGKEDDLILATMRHCEETERCFSGAGAVGSVQGGDAALSLPAIRMYLMQNTQNSCHLVLLLVVRSGKEEGGDQAALERLKHSVSYSQWAQSLEGLLQSPRTSLRYQHVLGPWNVVAFTAVGAYMGSNWSQWEDSIYDRVNTKRISVGYQPIVRKESP